MLVALALVILVLPLLLQRLVAPTRFGDAYLLDIGFFFSLVVAAYGAFPLLGIALADSGIGELHDARFGGVVPPQDAVFAVGLMYLLFLTGFVLTYAAVRRRAPGRVAEIPWVRPSQRDLWAAIGLLAAVKLSIFISRAILGIETSEDYLGTYLELAGQPLIVQQLLGILTASELSVTILVIVVTIARNPRLHVWVGALVALQIAIAILGGGSRSQAFTCALAYVVARSIFDRRLGFSFIVSAGAAGIMAFLVAGLLRQARTAGEELPSLYLLQGGEFLSVFCNSLDLADRLRELEDPLFRLGLYLVDLLRLIPRQVVGDLKLDPATFYTATFYPEFSEAGGGLAFGAVAEATIGFGPVEALVRGAFVGGLYAWVRQACLGPNRTVARAFIYTWFVVLSYQSIRDTTFSVFPRFVFQMLPLLIALRFMGVLRPHRLILSRIRPAALTPT